MTKLILKRGLLAGFINFVFSLILNWSLSIFFPNLIEEYQNTSIFRPFTDPLMTVYFAYPFILGLMLAYFWDRIQLLLKGKTPFLRSLDFALIYFLIATIPGMFITYTCFQLSLGLVIMWAISGFINSFIAGLVFVKIKS